MNYIGIDPGKDGALAVITDEDVMVFPFDRKSYVNILGALKNGSRCCLEREGAMPGQGGVSMFSFGENFGFIQGVLEANAIPYELVTPKRWKKEFGITADKNGSVQVCMRLFPTVSLLKTDRCRKPHDGMAEALLMAEYARRKMGCV